MSPLVKRRSNSYASIGNLRNTRGGCGIHFFCLVCCYSFFSVGESAEMAKIASESSSHHFHFFQVPLGCELTPQDMHCSLRQTNPPVAPNQNLKQETGPKSCSIPIRSNNAEISTIHNFPPNHYSHQAAF